ncbi:mannose-6-phosphate isomerase type 1 [Prosthecobacter fusiformis]|uniref:Mannose-6-phosphate isomerase type 1 n=1 Tax=Prosthecobacter fusiformis TaxID=48464 RepID=A0A4R7RKD2_9BACT|nr:type I phosphomannose isomerase catalytic subunit [Prosthecobacter fusiformis]TDU64657.1 mannose-6-phosphate isomerase type 1 [Prosthecobacter fusiformis]
MIWNRPLRFAPIYQTRVWGGRNLEVLFGRSLPDAEQPYGESWEISDRPEAQSIVTDGGELGMSLNELWQQHRVPVFGSALELHPSDRFPLLMKILDACDDLSIQVHPPASVAQELGGESKTEMWFITQAQEGARLYAGLRAGVTRQQFKDSLLQGTVADLMHSMEPVAGDCLFLPSGRVHAIGAGLVIFEIQQNSDTTYRVFDWNRTGLDGKPRALHIEESMRSIDFQDHEPEMQIPQANGALVSCEDFHVSHVFGDAEKLGHSGENLTVAVVEGGFTIQGMELKAGDFAVIPAALKNDERQLSRVAHGSQWLEIRIPPPIIISE